MPQRRQQLRQTLDELEGELRSLESLDRETRTILEEAAAEIQTALDKAEPVDFEPQSMIGRLQESVREFEADHPTLAGALERVINALGQMGI